VSVDLAGAADLHAHFGPDAHRARSVDALSAAREAASAGHAAVVLKNHDTPTAQLAAVLDDVVEGTRVLGGICCDREVGGVNPAAVETALRLGARIVWLPTLTSHQDQVNGVAAQIGIPGPGIRVTDDEGALLPETLEVMRLVEEHDAVLATGHVTAEEHYAVTREMGRRGKVLVTHAMEELAGPNLTEQQCVELAELGATVELCALTCIGFLATRPVAELGHAAATIGFDRVTLATDFGQQQNEHPAAGLQTFADALFDAGLAEADLRRMAVDNPLALLGLDPR
jgi:hypothetical protein